jgi:ketosteroid isomerase-like protein
MSQEDVELVRSLNLQAEVDWAAIIRNDELVQGLQEVSAPFFEPDFECAVVGVTDWLKGLDGLRRVWLDWLEPWATYRTEEDETHDLGDGRVLYTGHDYGGRRDGRGEIELRSSAIWSVREGKVTRIAFYAKREDALEAAGLAPG